MPAQTLPQLASDSVYLTDGGLETTLVFLEGLELPDFAAFPLLDSDDGRAHMERYFTPYLDIAERRGSGFVLDTATWRANRDWGTRLGYDDSALAGVNKRAVEFAASLAASRPSVRIVLDGVIGPRGDGYVVGQVMTADQAASYHSLQAQAFASAGAQMMTAVTMTYAAEAVGVVEAAKAAGIPVVVSFTVETDGRLPSGQDLGDAITEVDAATYGAAAYFMVNCAHPTHFEDVLEPQEPWIAAGAGDPRQRLHDEPCRAGRGSRPRPRRRGRARPPLRRAAADVARPARRRWMLRHRPRAHRRDR